MPSLMDTLLGIVRFKVVFNKVLHLNESETDQLQ